MASKQETFDTVVAHLRKQGRKSLDEDFGCMYRSPNGDKCAAGCLIPDADYLKEFEGWGVCSLSPTEPYGKVGACIRALGHDIDLVGDLQAVHDDVNVKDWELGFAAVAENHELVLSPAVANE